MALNITPTKYTLPEQNAVDSSSNVGRTFGNAIAAPMNTPNVPSGMGGIAIDRSAEVNAFNRIGNAINGVVDDIDRKEKALRKANETLAFVEAGQQHQSEWIEKQNTIKKLMHDGFYDPEGAKEQANIELQGLNSKYFGENTFQDEDIRLRAKIHQLEVTNSYSAAFKKDVIIPYQTSKYVERLNGVTTNASQRTSDAGRTGGADTAIAAYTEGRNQILSIYNSTEANMMMSPEAVIKERDNKLRQNGRAVIDGILARDFIPRDGGKYDPIQGAHIKLQAINDAQKLLIENPQLRDDIGVDADNLIRRMEEMKGRQLEFIQRQQDLAEKRAERQQKQAEKTQYNAVYSDLVRNGVESRYINEETILRLNLEPQMTDRLLEKKRQIENGELTFDQAYRSVEFNAKNGISMARPDKQNAQYLDNHYAVLTRDPAFRAQTPAQQAQQIATTYGAVGWLPEKFKADIAKGLRSSNPAVIEGTMTIMKSLDATNPQLITSFDPVDRAFYENVKGGMPIERATQTRDAQIYKTPDQKKLDDQHYVNASGAKKPYEVYDKNKAAFEKLSKKENSLFQFGAPTIPKGMIDDFDRRVREYAPQFNFDIEKAQERAYKDIAATAGVSQVNGARTLMFNAPEKVYRQASPENIQKQFKQQIEELKKLVPSLANKTVEDFGIVQDATYSSSSPSWQITVRDEDGNFMPLTAYDQSRGAAYFTYNAAADVAKAKEKEAKKKAEAEAKRGNALLNQSLDDVRVGKLKEQEKEKTQKRLGVVSPSNAR